MLSIQIPFYIYNIIFLVFFIQKKNGFFCLLLSNMAAKLMSACKLELPLSGGIPTRKVGKNLNRKTVGLGCDIAPSGNFRHPRSAELGNMPNMSKMQYSSAIVLPTEWKIRGVQKNMRYPQRNEKIGFIFVLCVSLKTFFGALGCYVLGYKVEIVLI